MLLTFLIDCEFQLEDYDEQLARALQESLSVESPPQYGFGNAYQPAPVYFPLGLRYIGFVLSQFIITPCPCLFIECLMTTMKCI